MKRRPHIVLGVEWPYPGKYLSMICDISLRHLKLKICVCINQISIMMIIQFCGLWNMCLQSYVHVREHEQVEAKFAFVPILVLQYTRHYVQLYNVHTDVITFPKYSQHSFLHHFQPNKNSSWTHIQSQSCQSLFCKWVTRHFLGENRRKYF